MRTETVALIPVREGSQRVKGKNFIEFIDGKSLLDIKIEQLKNTGCFEHIYLSSDSDNVCKIAQEKGVKFLKRKTKYCQADVRWAECIKHIIGTIPGNPLVTWALTTSPLFYNFEEALKQFNASKDHDSLVAVLAKKSFFLNKDGKGINFETGYQHPYSQELETYYEITGACYIGKKEDMFKWSYWFGPKPLLFEVSETESVDVDTPDDFAIGQKLYHVIHKG